MRAVFVRPLTLCASRSAPSPRSSTISSLLLRSRHVSSASSSNVHDSTELELVASEELVEIRPTVKMDKIRFISGVYGPFIGGRPVKVPLWMAVNLKLKKKCMVVCPSWLTVEYLQAKLSEETNKANFSQLPFRFAEIAKATFSAAEDLQQPDKLRSLLKDLREARQAKCRDGLRELDHNALSLANLCAMEINEIRPFFVNAMGVLIQLTAERPTSADEPEYD